VTKLPGRDQFVPLTRLVRILTLLSEASPGWVNRDRMIEQLGYGSATLPDQRDQLRREVNHLTDVGWSIQIDNPEGGGATTRLRLIDRDPRLATLLSDAEKAQLARAVRAADRDPQEFGLSHAASAPSLPVSLWDSQAARLEAVLHALHHRCPLHVRYNDCDRELSIDRVRQTGSGRWLVIAHDGGTQKQFRLDRFQRLSVGAPGTGSPPQPDTTDPDPLTIRDGSPTDAVVVTSQQHESHVVRELGEPSRRSETSDGVELTIRVINRRLWRMRLYQLGGRVRLIGPQELRDEVRAELQALAAGAR
jgi:predicted DNA-binding transcriptional regulator YafY